MRRLFVVRHGRTFNDGEPPRRIGARTDLPLVAAGVEEADRLGAVFARRGIVFTDASSGPLRRARDTARAILANQGDTPPIRICRWLDEVDHGVDENQPEAVVVDRIGTAALSAWDRRGICPPGWQDDARLRLAAWRRLFDDPSDGTMLAVTSSGSARFAAIALARAEQAALPATLKLGTGCFTEFSLTAKGWVISAWNIRP